MGLNHEHAVKHAFDVQICNHGVGAKPSDYIWQLPSSWIYTSGKT
jgi:hypothetical protein